MGRRTKDLATRFGRMVDRNGEPHLWLGGCDPTRGTGRFKLDGKDKTAPGGDPIVRLADRGWPALASNRFDGSPAHQPGSLFGDPPSVRGGVELAVPWGEPRLRAQLGGGREAGGFADLGRDRGDPGIAW